MNYNDQNICNEFSENIKYFKEYILCQTLRIPTSKPYIEKICDSFTDISIINQKIIKADVGLSNEGQKINGYKLVAEVCINQKVMYITDEATKSIFSSSYETLRNIFIVLPEYINGKDVCDLFKASRLVVRPYLEHSYTRKLSKTDFNTGMLLFLDIQIC